MSQAIIQSARFALPDSLRRVRSTHMWLTLWACLTSAAWLLPNHYYPWLAFHTDAWLACSFLLGGACMLVAGRAPVPWHGFTLLAFGLALLPPLQFLFGLLPYAGQAWTTGLYLLGFALSVLLGAHSQQTRPDVAVEGLFLAVGIAALASVGIQLYQWLLLSGAELWIMSLPDERPRPFGNLIQPNMMATFLLWGLVAVAWGTFKRRIGPIVAILAAAFLLMGVALTQSRTGMASLLMFYGLLWYWRRLWPSARRTLAAASLLVVWFVACLLMLEPVSQALLLATPYDAVERISGADIRWPVFKMFFDAALLEPWFGYGWSSVAVAQFAVAERHPAFLGIFQHAHNLFLDLVLWLGIPLGAVISAALIVWFARLFLRVRSGPDAILLMFLAALGLHAMLELPHQVAYMLLPAGLVIGALQVRLGMPVRGRSPRAYAGALWVAAAALFVLVARDYLLIEEDFRALRFERSFNMAPPAPPANAFVLDHLQAFVEMGRATAKAGMSAEELEQLRLGAEAFPSPSNLYLYTAALAMNGREEEARSRMQKMARIMQPSAYEQMGRSWQEQSRRNAALAKVEWLQLDAFSGAGTSGH